MKFLIIIIIISFVSEIYAQDFHNNKELEEMYHWNLSKVEIHQKVAHNNAI